MSGLPDPRLSGAVLIGVSGFRKLPELPAVRNNLAALAEALRDDRVWGLAARNCIVVEDPATANDMLNPIVAAAERATDTLLLYYAGHGLPDRRGDLHLAIVDSDPDPQRIYTAVPYRNIRDLLLDSRAARRIVILDCCYSGRALGQMAAPSSAVADGVSAQGTYVLAAAAENKSALAPPGKRYTAFTGELLDIIENGISGGGPLLDLDSIYRQLRRVMIDKGFPEPQKRDRNTAGQLTLVHNHAHRVADPGSAAGTSGAGTMPGEDQSAAGPPRIFGMPTRRKGGRAVGIDLGTTNAVIAVLEGGESLVIPNTYGSRTTPSVVAFDGGEVVVGEIAKRQAITNARRTIQSVNQQMGTGWSVSVDGKTFTAQQISAFILLQLKANTEVYLQQAVTHAVITVPAYFTDAQRLATKEAGQIAGLNVLRIINEPTSAALAYHLDKENEATILVFDLGGSTFSVSVLKVSLGIVEIEALSGDIRLGGNDWDQRIVDWLVKEFRKRNRVDLAKDTMAVQRLREAAEKAKIELSGSAETRIRLTQISRTRKGVLHLDMGLTRAEFQRMTSDLLDRCKAPFRTVIADAGVTVSEIDHVILAGGSAQMPAVVALIRELTGGKEPNQAVSPEHVVAVGASLQAAILMGEVWDVVID